ncbi:MAG: hypothetical protein GXO92_07815 [FCB group bacterium]|nr:hypothetical protein [FCB group bacterium]
MTFGKLLCLACFSFGIGFAQSVTKTTRTFYLGEEKVWVDIYERPGTNITFVNLHDNENTSAEAGRRFVAKYGGRLIELRHGRGREVVVRLHGELHRFDPNRMFSDAGLRSSLKYFRNNSDKVFAIAAAFRDSVIKLVAVREGMVIVALHNNTPDKMTINDYRPGGWYGKDTKKVSINPQRDPDNFFVVAQADLFSALSSLDYNVALRADDPPDRGMFLDYCFRHGGVFVAVEAEHGKLTEQMEMLEALRKILREKYLITAHEAGLSSP